MKILDNFIHQNLKSLKLIIQKERSWFCYHAFQLVIPMFFIILIFFASVKQLIKFTFLKVRTRFLGPTQHPLIMTKSCLTSP